MLSYFDECYDNGHVYLILATLFNPKPHKLHKAFLEAKRERKFVKPNGQVREIGYNDCYNKRMYIMAKRAIDCFINSPSYFRAIVIDQRVEESGYDLNKFGKPDEPDKDKEAKAYKKFTEILLDSHCSEFCNAIMLFDRLTRPKNDLFVKLLRDKFCEPVGRKEPRFRHMQAVDTGLEQYHIGQIGDILQGAILNELVPPENEWKCKVREYLKERLGIPNLTRDYWQNLPKRECTRKHPQYQVWYWRANK